MSLYTKSAWELSEMLRSKQCSAIEICDDVLSRINSVENTVGAYVTITDDKARENAKKIDEAISRNENLHPLAGIPIGIKDNISTKHIKTTCASRMLENYIPPFNATVMEKINSAGMTVLGKLNMDEFAMGSSTETSYMHLTRNPHNIECVPGGSSGGSAAAIASGEAILTLGSDTGGSIRQPAALCGAVGLKPTYGSVSRYGLVAFASSLDQIGPLGKSVRDVAMLQSLICGHDKMDATSKRIDYPDYSSALKDGVKGMRIGLPKEYFGPGIDDSVKTAVMKAVKDFEAEGAVIKEISLPNTEFAINTYYIIASAEAASNLARFDGVRYGYRAQDYKNLTYMYERTRSEGFGDEVKCRIMLGTFVLSAGYSDAYYNKAKLVQKKIASEFENAFKECDIIATPTVPASAFKIGENINDHIKMYYNDICTVTANIAGLPAISVPCGRDQKGMPMGLQLIGNKFNEQILLNTAYTYEKMQGGFDVISKTLEEVK